MVYQREIEGFGMLNNLKSFPARTMIAIHVRFVLLRATLFTAPAAQETQERFDVIVIICLIAVSKVGVVTFQPLLSSV
ncbi:uncharacterized [Tachysurus ichikawai]